MVAKGLSGDTPRGLKIPRGVKRSTLEALVGISWNVSGEHSSVVVRIGKYGPGYKSNLTSDPHLSQLKGYDTTALKVKEVLEDENLSQHQEFVFVHECRKAFLATQNGLHMYA